MEAFRIWSLRFIDWLIRVAFSSEMFFSLG